MEKQKKKQIKKYISWVLLLTLVAFLAALPLIAAQKEQSAGPQASVLSATVQRRDIATAVLGGGTLTAQEALDITIPAAVRIKEYLVSNGEIVTGGQPVASVDRVSVMSAITQVQETMTEIRKELNSISSKTETTKLTATAGGTVKTVYASEGENVQDVMLRNGALAVISLDNLMAVQVARSTNLLGGDTVCVTLPDGTQVDGRVESNLEGVLTVTLEDEGYGIGDQVKLTTQDGARIGSGELYVHNPWNVVAYAGTVSRVRIGAGDTVRAGSALFTLADTGHTARFDALSGQHREYEALMLELFKMYQSETVNAPGDGMITGADESGSYMLSGSGGGWELTLLANGPNGDENTYTNYIGQVTQVGTDGLIMKMNPQPFSVSDYQNLSGIPLDTQLMTESTVYAGNAPIYVLSNVSGEGETEKNPNPGAAEPDSGTGLPEETSPDSGPAPETDNQIKKEWVQLSPYAVTAGDILLFAGDSSGVVWAVRVGHVELAQPPQSPRPDTSTQQSSRAPQSGVPGGSGSKNQEESGELYGLDTVTIASVTAQQTMTVQVTVDELDISKISVGQAAAVTVDALAAQQFEGTVTGISASGENEGGNSKFSVEVTLEKNPQMLPGMRTAVTIVLHTLEEGISLPVAALTETGTKTLVYRSYNEETEEFADPVEVATGVSDGEYVQILSGITEGETVYYPYYDTLVISNIPESGGRFSFG